MTPTLPSSPPTALDFQRYIFSSPDGTITDTVYDAEGRVSYSDDPHVVGQADVRGTHTIYDTMGRVTETDRLDGIVITVSTTNGVSSSQLTTAGTVLSRTSSVYNDLGQVTQTTDAASQTTKFQYDADGRQTSVTDPLNEITLSGYDAAGRQTTNTDPLSHISQSVYDPDGRITKSIATDGSYNLTSYDTRGRQNKITDPMGRKTTYQYDTFGRMTAVVLPAVLDPETGKTVNPTTSYGYDNYGNLTSITDAKGRVTNFTFDAFGHQLTRTLPLGQTESTTYDAFGRMATHVDFKGQQEVFHYDSLGRMDTKTLYAAGSNTAGETVTYHFDSLGRNDTVTDVIGTTTRLTSYGFDLENRVTSITTPEGTINYAYDSSTGFHTRTFTANSDITYAPDALQRLKTVTVTKQNGVTLTTPLVTTYFYTSVGAIDHVTYPNTTETDYGYDTLNRLTSVTNKRGTTLLSSYVYTLENDGLRTGVTEQQLEADSTYSTVTKTWTYDSLQRLTQEAVTSSISANSYTDTYVMDLVGNRLSKTHTQGGQTQTSTYTYNSNDQLTTETGSGSSTYSTAYGYDTNGSLTSVTRTGSGAETDSYGYDLQNRMMTANIARTESGQSVTIAASYSYNDDGIRALGVVTTTIGTGSPTTTTTQYLVDSNNPTGYTQVFEEHTNGAATPSMSYLVGLSIIGQTNGSGVQNYLLADGQSSTRLVVDGSGNVVMRYGYDAFGNLLGQSLGVLNVPATSLLYTGQQFDPRLLQYYLRARYYAPGVGRFGELDSLMGAIRAPISLHKYLYAAGNPISNLDPTGMFTQQQGYDAEHAIEDIYEDDHPGQDVIYGKWTRLPGKGFRLKPDIFNRSMSRWAEIKPLTPSGVAKAGVKYKLYNTVFKFFGYQPDAGWTPSTHEAIAGTMPIIFFNAGGIIFYTDIIDGLEDLVALTTLALVRSFLRSPAGQRFLQGILGALRDRIPGLAASRVEADEDRLGDQAGMGGLLALMGDL